MRRKPKNNTIKERKGFFSVRWFQWLDLSFIMFADLPEVAPTWKFEIPVE